jgi:hypothetical protein
MRVHFIPRRLLTLAVIRLVPLHVDRAPLVWVFEERRGSTYTPTSPALMAPGIEGQVRNRTEHDGIVMSW